ncbi:bifunctional hydroxymethylpyrimidine kinase/phosphomethylpyrimidine kinase [Curtobacterium sp. MCBA15_001]|uniref:bifunctional hydroxymethylpyrimidine kinase/phosphomethylpyrimidine kinase n=1 Tax=Curtobacterium sp. MCBA15_001 TaxID=1898731 RepID=UPI0008DE5B6B|nr:bifunctional hydroxymethylpyrimidine kinase/phosphomethylpyrimidine kinase [Curtobacterium sp. MCBA15_001]OIH92781.1 bifunctional hydroxymethylpyrimidine kinase/phosphomethylpyrimidine kinase [Curtobacterium sp. MCBA15_001]
MSGPVRVLSIAGTDPTGGAGLQADLKAIAAHDGYGMAVVTAVVAQNTHGVRSVHVPDVSVLRDQLEAVSDDVVVDAVKVGMLGTAAVVRQVAEWLRAHRPPVVVVDPVMVATSGDRLLDRDAERAMTELFALADLVTPNRPELAVLARLATSTTPSDTLASSPTDPVAAARLVAAAFDVRVLAKGGHGDGPTSDDVLVAPDGSVRWFPAQRIATSNTHGTGCSLSSAVATLMAQHGDWEVAVGAAKTWLTAALRGADALRVGTGNGPVDHGAVVRAERPAVASTDLWWRDVEQVLDGTLRAPFLTQLASGTLADAVFAGYLAQDVHYLRAYEHHLAALSTATSGDAADFWAAAAAGCATEAATLHHRRLAGRRAEDAVHPVCAGYLAHLDAAARDSTEVLAAAVLPCFRVYAWVGEQLGAPAPDHPFADWVTAYGDPGFAAASRAATAHVEAMAAAASPVLRGRMARAFRTSTIWEREFFAMPYALGASRTSSTSSAAPTGAEPSSAAPSTVHRIHVKSG